MQKDFKNIQEEMAYASKNREATFFLNTSAEDYIASRCLLINYLLYPGLVLGQQAIEKIIKASIKYCNPKINLKKIHSLIDLKIIYEKETSNQCLTPFETILKRLDEHYKSRYPDNLDSSTRKSSSELGDVDELYLLLLDKLKIPEVLKYRSDLFSYLFNKQLVATTGSYKWVTLKNQALKTRLENYKLKYRETYDLTY